MTLNAPVHGGRYLVGQSVPASFSCSDARGVSSCTGTAPNGAAVNTSAAGTRQFSMERAMRNKEYRAFLGFLAVLALLAARAYF